MRLKLEIAIVSNIGLFGGAGVGVRLKLEIAIVSNIVEKYTPELK